MHIYLLRHGESVMNLPSWKSSQLYDGGLTERGHRQARAAALWVKENIAAPDVIYCSTLKRTRETGAYFSELFGLPLQMDDRIREIGNNRVDHTALNEEGFSYSAYWASERPFSSILHDINGETMMHFRTRIGIFLEELLEKHLNQVILVVCHGFVIDMFFDLAFNVGHYRMCEVWTSNTGLSHFQFINHTGRERWRLHFQNRVEHLLGVGGLGLTVGGNAAEDIPAVEQQKLGQQQEGDDA